MSALSDGWLILLLSGASAFLYTTALCDLYAETRAGDKALLSPATRRGVLAFALAGMMILLLMRQDTLGPDSPELVGALVTGAFLGAARVIWTRLVVPRS